MIKLVAAVMLVLFAITTSTAAKAADEAPPALNTVVTPDSPAFVLLGVSPTEIQRPTDPRAFAAAVVPAVVSSKGLGVAPGFALETAPYWWRSRPTLELKEYARGGFGALIRNLSVSAASTETAGNATTSTGLANTNAADPKAALGLRTTLWHGEPSSSEDECGRKLSEAADRIGRGIVEAIARRELRPDDVEGIKKKQAELMAEWPAVSAAIAEQCAKAASARKSVVVDLAGATSFVLPNGKFDGTKVSGYAGWLTVAVLPSTSFSLIALGRYRADGIEGPAEERSLDAGLRVAYAWQKFGIGLEGVYRNNVVTSGRGYAIRSTVSFDALVSESLWVTLTAGRDYAPTDDHPFISLAGLKWNFDTAKERTVDPAKYANPNIAVPIVPAVAPPTPQPAPPPPPADAPAPATP